MSKMSQIATLQEFEDAMQSDTPIVLDFYTETCNPCKTLMSILEKLAFENKGKINFLKSRADLNPELSKLFRVSTVPTLILADKDKNMEKANGLITENSLRRKVGVLIG